MSPIPFLLASLSFLMLTALSVEAKGSSWLRGIVCIVGMCSTILFFYVGLILICVELPPLKRELCLLDLFSLTMLLIIIEVRTHRKKDESVVS